MDKKHTTGNIREELSRRKFLGLVAGSAAFSLFNTAPIFSENHTGRDDFPVLTDYVNRLCYNENSLGPSPLAMQAISDNIDMSHRYPDWYAGGLKNYLANSHDVNSGQVIAGCGATEILRLAALSFITGGNNIVSPYPSYSQFPSDADLIGADIHYSYLDGNYDIDLDDMASRVDSSTQAVIITNPNNPTGRVLSADDIEDFVDNLPSQVVAIIDEAYHEYVDDPSYETAIRLVQDDRKVIVIRTFSKVYGLAGLRIGYAIGRQELISQMQSWLIYASITRLSQAAAIAALEDQEHIDNTVTLNNEAKAYCFDYFDQNEMRYVPSQTNFFLLETEFDSAQLANLLNQRGVSVRTGWGLQNHIRVSTGTMTEMESFITALDDILNDVGVTGNSLPVATSLEANYPNPFNGSTKISYNVSKAGPVLIRIFNIRGQLVKTVLDEYKLPGHYAFDWNGRAQSGKPVASGSYFYRMTSRDYTNTRRMILIK